MALAAANRAGKVLRDDQPVIVSVDNSAESLAALIGLAVRGTDMAIIEAASPLLRDGRSVLHRLGAHTVIGPADAPARYRVLPAADLTRPVPEAGTPRTLASRTSDDPAVWQSTSGSTGEPRLARQTVMNLLRGGVIYARRFAVSERDQVLVTVPMAHSFGVVGGLMCALVSGAALTTLSQYRPRAVREAIEAGASVMLGTPLVYELVARSARPGGSGLRMALSSGGPLEPSAAAAARERLGCPVYQIYGSTETGIIASQFPRGEPWPAGCAGTAAPGVELRLPGPGQEAELWVRTSTMFSGYLNDTGAVPGAGGWYRTGDVATLDPAGHLTLVRRKESFINVGGRKVNPARVQRILSGHEAVAEVAAYGVGTVGGEEVWAAVTLSSAATAEQLVSYCRQHLAAYEVPYRLHLLDQLPRNGMGKVDRSQLPHPR